MSDTKDYSKLFEQAEKAVSSVKDEGLRKIAFEKLVSRLLADGSEENEENRQSKRKKSSGQARAKNSVVKKDGPLAWLRGLVDDGFFNQPKSSSNIREELETQGHHLKATDLTAPLRTLCNEKLLRRKKMSPKKGSKAVWHWVIW